jgi:hypothetical protein
VYLDIYCGEQRVARFEFGAQPLYAGDLGQVVRAAVEAPRLVCNPWTGETADGPRWDTWQWWASSILNAGLGHAGLGPDFFIYGTDVPLGTSHHIPAAEQPCPTDTQVAAG